MATPARPTQPYDASRTNIECVKTLKDPLVWIDCEMTGLDVERDALIEVAVVVTDGDLRIVDPGMDVLITPPRAH